MTAVLTFVQWINFVVSMLLFASITGHSESNAHTRHPHSGNAHRRPIRDDSHSRYEANYESNSRKTEFVQIYSEQQEKITLTCVVNINFSTIIWLKDSQIVQTILKDNINNKRVSGHRFLVDSLGNLIIDNVRLEDDGRWQCEVEDAFGSVISATPFQLTVLDPPRKPYLLIDKRILDPGNLFIPVKENAELTVSCVIDNGNPKPTLTWELALGSLALLDVPEVPYQAFNFTQMVREQRLGTRSDVRLERIMRAHHNATLTCLVNHIALKHPMNVSLLLDVQYAPSFAISREPGFGIPIREGIPVSLKCDVDANPKAPPIWQKDDSSPPVQQSPDGFLNFTEIRREHSGWYKCISKHLLGRFSSIGYFLNVRYGLDVTQEPDFNVRELSSTGGQVEVDLGGAVQLACPTGSSGCWSRLDSGKGLLEPLGSSPELFIHQILYQEAGEYRCVPPNEESKKRLDLIRHSLPINVTVSGRPMVYPINTTITAVYGQPLTLQMEFCANPAYNRIFWIARDHIIRPGDNNSNVVAHQVKNSSISFCHQAVLYLTSVTHADLGEYSFIVRSPNGIAEGIFTINMTYASGYVNEPATDSNSPVVTNLYINIFIFIYLYIY